MEYQERTTATPPRVAVAKRRECVEDLRKTMNMLARIASSGSPHRDTVVQDAMTELKAHDEQVTTVLPPYALPGSARKSGKNVSPQKSCREASPMSGSSASPS